MTGDKIAVVLHSADTLDGREAEIAKLAGKAAQYAIGCKNGIFNLKVQLAQHKSVEQQNQHGAYKAALAGKRCYTPRAFYKLYKILAKFLPVGITMKMAKT